MRITKVKLDNYVCFYNAPEFELGPGINFVVGKNNSGKTALLDVLSHMGEGEPHRSMRTAAQKNVTQPSSNTSFEITYEFTEGELLEDLFAETGSFYFPIPEKEQQRGMVRNGMPQGLLVKDKACIKYWYKSNKAEKVKLEEFFHEYDVGSDSKLVCYKATPPKPNTSYSPYTAYDVGDGAIHGVRANDTGWAKVAGRIPRYLYRFVAERRIAATALVEAGGELKSDASNLASVLIGLDYNRDEYLNLVRRVIPEICYYRCVPGKGTVELRLSYYPPDSGHHDLAVSLDKCGTGVGQVLAMLYVVLSYTKSDPQVIVIDEPNSFLHPDAVRNLLTIFQEHDHHQYIIATHSPVAMSSVREKTVLHVIRDGMQSRVKTIAREDSRELVESIRSVGYRLSDIFGTDVLVWVEGPTEVQCFPLLLEQQHIDSDRFRFIPLGGGGKLTQQRAELFADLYEKVAKTIGLLPEETMIVHDADIEPNIKNRDSLRKVGLEPLPRQNYESYLIVPEILADILKRDGADERKGHSTDSVSTWIRDNSGGHDYNDPDWLQKIDGAKFLVKLFNELAGISYGDNKVAYGVEITERILERDKSADHFQDIVDILKPLLQPNQSQGDSAQT